MCKYQNKHIRRDKIIIESIKHDINKFNFFFLLFNCFSQNIHLPNYLQPSKLYSLLLILIKVTDKFSTGTDITIYERIMNNIDIKLS